jgi:hypothetical protein
MPRIFISYRREETAYPAGWLFDRLEARYGEEQIFKDVDSIAPGEDFVERITTAVASCDVLLALIGDEWLTVADEGGRRLDNPKDFVRVEIEAALARKVRVVPVLVDGAAMPEAEQLPPSLAPLSRRQALELSPQRFDFDTNRLLDALDKMVADGEVPPAPARPGRSRRTLIAVGLAAAALLLLVPAVVYATRGSSDEPPSGTPATTAAAGQDWVAEANKICANANDTINDLPEPDAASLDSVGVDALVRYGVTAVNINKRMVRDLAALTPPPDQRRAHKELVSRGAAMTEAAEELFASFRTGDILAAQRQQAAVSRSGQRFDAQALKVGATTCAEGASLGASFGG